jgi:hypothetical protein
LQTNKLTMLGKRGPQDKPPFLRLGTRTDSDSMHHRRHMPEFAKFRIAPCIHSIHHVPPSSHDIGRSLQEKNAASEREADLRGLGDTSTHSILPHSLPSLLFYCNRKKKIQHGIACLTYFLSLLPPSSKTPPSHTKLAWHRMGESSKKPASSTWWDSVFLGARNHV